MLIQHLLGRLQLLLSSGINRRKDLPSSSAVTFAAFVDTFSFESQARSSQRVFLSLEYRSSLKIMFGKIITINIIKKIEDKNEIGLHSVFLSALLLPFYCAQRVAPGKCDVHLFSTANEVVERFFHLSCHSLKLSMSFLRTPDHLPSFFGQYLKFAPFLMTMLLLQLRRTIFLIKLRGWAIKGVLVSLRCE